MRPESDLPGATLLPPNGDESALPGIVATSPADGALYQDQLIDLLSQAPAFMAVMRGPRHVFNFVNAAYYQLVGHRDVTGKSVHDALPEVRDQGFIDLLDQVLETGVPFVGDETPILLQRTPDSPLEQRYVNFVFQPIGDQPGSLGGIFAHGVDVTDLVRARRQSEELAAQIDRQARAYDAMLSSIQDFVYCFDLDGRFLFANDALLNLLGLDQSQITGKTFHDLPYPRALATTLQDHIATVIASGQPLRDETSYTSPAGRAGYYEYIFVPILGPNGNIEQVAGSTREVTHYKEMERQKDDFIAIASHELKTPVTSIKAYAQILQRRFAKEQNAKAVDLLGKMDAQLDKLTGLIGDLLDSTKIVSGKFQLQRESFDFAILTAEIIEEMQRTTVRHRLSASLDNSIRVHADRDRIGQVMTNLISNAIKYSPAADRIDITASAEHGEAVFRVRDFGPGLSPESRTHVFERFYRGTDADAESIPGLGLGLYISAEIIRHHDGRIWVESIPPPGAVFGFALPSERPGATGRPE